MLCKVLTCGVNECRVELFGKQRVSHVPEEFLQKRGHVMDTVFLVQLHVHTAVKLLPQLWQRNDGIKIYRFEKVK